MTCVSSCKKLVLPPRSRCRTSLLQLLSHILDRHYGVSYHHHACARAVWLLLMGAAWFRTWAWMTGSCCRCLLWWTPLGCCASTRRDCYSCSIQATLSVDTSMSCVPAPHSTSRSARAPNSSTWPSSVRWRNRRPMFDHCPAKIRSCTPASSTRICLVRRRLQRLLSSSGMKHHCTAMSHIHLTPRPRSVVTGDCLELDFDEPSS